MPTPTKLFMNWVNVTVTPEGGSAIVIDGVTGVQVHRGSRQEIMYGDARAFARLIKDVEKKRGMTIMSANLGAVLSIGEDIACVVTATLLDPRNGAVAGGGAFTVTLSNAFIEKTQAEGQNNKYASGSATFNGCGAVAGIGAETDPLSITPL